MPFVVDDTRHWSERAMAAHAIARILTDPVAKRTMEEVAAAYERMAERAVARDEQKTSERSD